MCFATTVMLKPLRRLSSRAVVKPATPALEMWINVSAALRVSIYMDRNLNMACPSTTIFAREAIDYQCSGEENESFPLVRTSSPKRFSMPRNMPCLAN